MRMQMQMCQVEESLARVGAAIPSHVGDDLCVL